MRALRAVAVAALLLLTGCTGAVRSYDVYASKAGNTAKSMRSAVETARVAVDVASHRRVFGRTLSHTLSEAADDASSTQSIFDAIQPPDSRSDALRDVLDNQLTDAVDTLSTLRTAARRGDVHALPGIAAKLGEVSKNLDALATRYS